MSHQDCELERTLAGLIEAHRTLLRCVEAHQSAMKRMDMGAMRQAGIGQEAARRRIAAMDRQRQALVARRARELRLVGEVTLAALAKADARRGAELSRLRDELRGLVEETARRARVASRLAEAVLGHLNMAVRLLGGAMQRAGVYTRSGAPPTAGRIGVMEAVG